MAGPSLRGRTPFGWAGNAYDTIGISLVLAVGLLIGPGLTVPLLVPKRVALLAVTPLGLALLVGAARRRSRVAQVGLLYVLWALVVAVVSDGALVSIAGVVNRHQSVLMLAGVVGCWAIGRACSPWGRPLLARALFVVCTGNLVFSIAQLAAQPTGALALDLGRPTGLMSSPVHLGALAAAVAVWVAQEHRTRSSEWSAVAYAIPAYVAGLTSTRVPTAIILLLAVFVVARERTLRSAQLLVSAIASLTAAIVTYRLLDSDQDLQERAISSGGLGHRRTVWSFGLQGWWDRPLTGFGVGRFHIAAQSHLSDAWAFEFQGDGWKDAHNIVVEVLATQGAIGLGIAAVLGWAIWREATGPLRWVGGVIALTWLLQPASLVTMPIAALLLGAASSSQPEGRVAGSCEALLKRTSVLALVTCGALLGGSLLVGDALLARSRYSVDAAPLSGARAWYRYDPEVLDNIAELVADDDTLDFSERSLAALRWSERSVRAEPDNTTWLTSLATYQMRVGMFGAADETVRRASELRSNDLLVLRLDVALALRAGDTERAKAAAVRVCEITGLDCRDTLEDLSDGVLGN